MSDHSWKSQLEELAQGEAVSEPGEKQMVPLFNPTPRSIL